MPFFEGEDGAYEPVEMGLYKPYEVVVKFNAEDCRQVNDITIPPGSPSMTMPADYAQRSADSKCSANYPYFCIVPKENGWYEKCCPQPVEGCDCAKGDASHWNVPGNTCGSRSPDSIAKLDKKACLEMGCYWWSDTEGCHGNTKEPRIVKKEDGTTPGTPWYVQEVVPSVPNWLLAGGAGIALIAGYLYVREDPKKGYEAPESLKKFPKEISREVVRFPEEHPVAAGCLIAAPFLYGLWLWLRHNPQK